MRWQKWRDSYKQREPAYFAKLKKDCRSNEHYDLMFIRLARILTGTTGKSRLIFSMGRTAYYATEVPYVVPAKAGTQRRKLFCDVDPCDHKTVLDSGLRVCE